MEQSVGKLLRYRSFDLVDDAGGKIYLTHRRACAVPLPLTFP